MVLHNMQYFCNLWELILAHPIYLLLPSLTSSSSVQYLALVWSPTCLQWGLLSVDKASSVSETGEVSIPVPRPQIKTQILAETVQIPTGSWKPSLRSWVAASFKVDNQGLCEAKLVPTHRACAAPQSCCRAVGRRSCGSPGLFLISDNSRSTDDHCNQCWIIRATHVFLLDYGCSEASFTNTGV